MVAMLDLKPQSGHDLLETNDKPVTLIPTGHLPGHEMMPYEI